MARITGSILKISAMLFLIAVILGWMPVTGTNSAYLDAEKSEGNNFTAGTWPAVAPEEELKKAIDEYNMIVESSAEIAAETVAESASESAAAESEEADVQTDTGDLLIEETEGQDNIIEPEISDETAEQPVKELGEQAPEIVSE
jgi:hypothetical protein